MHPFSVLTLGIFVAGYITARWDLVTRLYELAGFAWNHGVVVGCDYPYLPPGLECEVADHLNPPDSGRERLRGAFDLLLSLHHTH